MWPVRAMSMVKATDVVRVLHKAAETWGYPASFLTDNGLIFTAQRHYGVAGAIEQELFALGIEAKHSRPYHPQTCGKVERFHQTMKKFLATREHRDRETAAAATRSLRRVLQRRCVRIGASARKTPARCMQRREKAVPSPHSIKIGRPAAAPRQGRQSRLG